ncbi:MAG: YidB family protein [Ignavibacteriaceae bacterium]
MDLMDSLKSAIGGGNKQNDLMSIIMSLIGGQGGINNLISQFAAKGLGDVINSWIGTGKNLPISGDQLQSVFGKDKISQLASKVGMDNNAFTSQLSNLLPQVIDKLTPDGKVPEGDIMSKGMDLLGGLLGNK